LRVRDRHARGSHRLGFVFRLHYAHKCILPVSSVEDAVEAACWISDPVHTQASGIFGSPVGTQLQVKEMVFWTK
jgi:hypothetical protein